MQNYLFQLTTICLFFLLSCANNTLDDVTEELETTPEIVTYIDVKPIVSGNCISCHSNPPQNGAPMSLETYLDVKNAVLNRDLLNRISLPEGNSNLMPKGGPRLPQSNIDLFNKWNQDGLLENPQ